MVKVELSRLEGDYHMVAVNDRGNIIHLDDGGKEGGLGAGFGPMQSLLAAFGGCSTIDVVSILKKQRQELKDIKITVTGEREAGAVPSLYKTINAHFKLYGDIDPDKAEKAVSLSVEKYCSVAETLRRSGAKVTHSFEIINDN
jgi:putative redox protein